MRRPLVVCMGGFILTVLLVGCGSNSGSHSGPSTSGAALKGKIQGVSNPASYQILVDGRPTKVRAGAKGGFTIPGVPPGRHTIAVVSGNGMSGGYAAVTVGSGGTVTIGDITPTLGGQIGGIVTKALSDGGLQPVEGVEVIATPASVWIQNGQSASRPIPIGGGGTGSTVAFGAYTDQDGSYLIKAVPVGGYDVSVTVPGFEPQVTYLWVSGGQLTAANFTVQPAPEQGVGTVEGVVTGGGALLEGAQVTVTVGDPWVVPVPGGVAGALAKAHLAAGLAVPGTGGGGTAKPPYIAVRVFGTLTDHLGRYSLNLPAGTANIECWLEGWDWQGDQIVIRKDTTITRNFDLQKGQEPPPPVTGGGTEPGSPGASLKTQRLGR